MGRLQDHGSLTGTSPARLYMYIYTPVLSFPCSCPALPGLLQHGRRPAYLGTVCLAYTVQDRPHVCLSAPARQAPAADCAAAAVAVAIAASVMSLYVHVYGPRYVGMQMDYMLKNLAGGLAYCTHQSVSSKDNNEGGQIESHKLRIYPLDSHQVSKLSTLVV